MSRQKEQLQIQNRALDTKKIDRQEAIGWASKQIKGHFTKNIHQIKIVDYIKKVFKQQFVQIQKEIEEQKKIRQQDKQRLILVYI